MRRALPDRERDLHTLRPRPLGVADGISEQHFVVSNIDANPRHAPEERMERRRLVGSTVRLDTTTQELRVIGA